MTPQDRDAYVARLRLLPREDQAALYALQIQEEAGRLEGSLRLYAQRAFHIVEPETPFVPGWHIDAICEHLEAVSSGAIRNLVINMPPRHMKSLLVSVFWMTWEWTRRPELRYLFASFNEELATRDSRKCRLIIESAWYGARWGNRVVMASDQNLKSRFENTRTGMRFASGTSGAQMGEGGDRIVCLEGSTPIMTDCGLIPIGKIVDRRLPVRILGSSGRYQTIDAYEKNPGRPSVEIATSDGARFVCTEDHAVFIEGSGYIPAKEMIDSLRGDILLRRLRDDVRALAGAREEVAATVLFSVLLRYLRTRRRQSRLDWRSTDASMRALSGRIQVESGGGRASAVLLPRLRRAGSERGAADGMPDLSFAVHPDQLPATLLQHAMCFGPAPYDGSRSSQRSLSRREEFDQVQRRVSEDSAAGDRETRRRSLRSLRCDKGDCDSSGPSHRCVEDESCADESGDALSKMSPYGAYQDRAESRVDEPVRLASARRVCAPDAVYNLRVTPDHDYYAAGVLTHNCDDAHNPTPRSFSDDVREGTLAWWDQTMSTRYSNPQTVAKVIVGQRLHERDLPGHVLSKSAGSQWVHLNLPAEYEPKPFVEVNAIGWSDPRTEPGELLWPERFTQTELADAKRDLGSYGYASQFQQRPSPAGGGLLKREWWRLYDVPPPFFDEVIQSWDLAFKDAATSSYVVGLVLGRVGGAVYILDRVRERLDFPATCRAMTTMTARWPSAAAKLVEDKANGPAVIAQMRATIPGLIPISPRGSKEARASAISPFVESGNVYLPAHADWVEDFIQECASFPRGAFNDQVDAFTQGLDRLLIATDGVNQLIPFAAVERAIDRPFIVEHGWAKTMSVVGGRETILTLRYGPVIRQQWALPGIEGLEAVTARVVHLVRAHYVPLLMVDTSEALGSALLAQTRSLLGDARVRGFNASDKARRDDKYDDRRTEIAYALRDEFVFDRISIPNNPLLVAQLTGMKVAATERGRVKMTGDLGTFERAAGVLTAYAAESVSVATGTPGFLQ